MTSTQSLFNDSFLVEGTGDVYVNGVKKSTRLPEMIVGTKVNYFFKCIVLPSVDISLIKITSEL